MDSDFGRPYAPRERLDPQSTPQQEMPSEPPAQAPMPQPTTHYKRSGARRFFTWLLLLILIAGAAYGVYYWQNQEVKDLKKQLAAATAVSDQQQKDKAELVATKLKLDAATSDNLVPGQVVNDADGNLIVTALFKSTTVPDEVWIEYGDSYGKLDKNTEHTGMIKATEGSKYTSLDQTIKKADVKAETTYFYRVASKKGAVTTTSAVASFTTPKENG